MIVKTKFPVQKKRCPECRSPDVAIKYELALVPAKGESRPGFSYMQPQIHCQADDCGEICLAPEHRFALHDAFCKLRGLLTPDEIKQHRAAYGARTPKGKISQKDFARVLGLGDITITRYESRSQMQNKSVDMLIRASTLPGFGDLLPDDIPDDLRPVRPKIKVGQATGMDDDIIYLAKRFPQVEKNLPRLAAAAEKFDFRMVH